MAASAIGHPSGRMIQWLNSSLLSYLRLVRSQLRSHITESSKGRRGVSETSNLGPNPSTVT